MSFQVSQFQDLHRTSVSIGAEGHLFRARHHHTRCWTNSQAASSPPPHLHTGTVAHPHPGFAFFMASNCGAYNYSLLLQLPLAVPIHAPLRSLPWNTSELISPLPSSLPADSASLEFIPTYLIVSSRRGAPGSLLKYRTGIQQLLLLLLSGFG